MVTDTQTGYRAMSTSTPRKSFWSTLPGIATAVGGFLTAVAALVAALTGAGFLGPHDQGGRGTTPSAVATAAPVTTIAPTAVSTPQEGQPGGGGDRAEVQLVYPGDNYGCVLQMIVNIGGQTAYPNGSSFTMENVPTGVQRYSIRGTISCQTVGHCTATGSGSVSVSDGVSYTVNWLNTAVGRCTVTLSE